MKIEPPVRASRRYLQKLAAPPERVFQLLCPVREVEWAEGWDPELVVSASGLVEPDCVFTTKSDGREAVWVVTRHDPERFRLELLKVTPGLVVTKIEISLAAATGGGTEADVAYTHTALSAEGRLFVVAFTDQAYEAFMRQWEDELNRFLAEGR